MDRGTMWLLVSIFCTTVVTGDGELASSHDFLHEAIAGFDPFYMTSITSPNPGRRSLLFEQSRRCESDSQLVYNSFIENVEETNCLPEITVRNIANYKDYKDFLASIAYVVSFDASLGTLFGYDNFTSCEDENNSRDRTILQFFKDTGGEVVLATSSCVTHTVTISHYEPVTFTYAFERALTVLYQAALNTTPKIRNTTFAKFIWYYGTHFSRRTRLGSRAIFGKLFSTRASTVAEETARRRCVREAAFEALTPTARNSNETTRTVFTRALTKRCGGEEHKSIVAVTGPLPDRSLEDWASAAKKSPRPIFHDLEPLSSLFNNDWFDLIQQSMELDMNSTALSNLFEEQFSDYSSRMVCGGSNKSSSRGCTIDSNCTDGMECRNEPYTTTGYICVPKDDAMTTNSISSTATTPATTTSTTSTIEPSPSSTTILKPCPDCQTCPACQSCPTCPACQSCPTCPGCEICQTQPSSLTCPTSPTPSECVASSGLLIAEQGVNKTLTSHIGFGTSYYTHDATSSHIIKAPSEHKVRIRFQSFYTEPSYDKLYIHDGSSHLGTQLAELSGSPSLSTLSSYTSSRDRMFLLFITDGSVANFGFSLLYDAVV